MQLAESCVASQQPAHVRPCLLACLAYTRGNPSLQQQQLAPITPPLHVQESLDAALLRELGEARMAQLVTRTGSPLKVGVCGGGGGAICVHLR